LKLFDGKSNSLCIWTLLVENRTGERISSIC
jgi:hypothetical protein